MRFVELPVAAILKGWHFLLADIGGIDASTAWIFAIILLVVTVRSLLVPLAYRQFRAGRLMANSRPELQRIEAEFAGKRDAESRKEMSARRREVMKENNVSLADGCLTALIQVPVLIGLYRLLLRIAGPEEGPHAAHNGFGLLTPQDVQAFLETRLFGVPLPAYVAMADQQLAFLGTTRDHVLHVAIPFIIMASVFTTANYAYSMRRNMRTTDYSQAFARFMVKLMFAMGPLFLLFPWILGLTGPAPLALLLYWVSSNLWTMMQVFLLQRYLDRTVPYSDEFWAYSHQQKQLHRQRKASKKGKENKGKEPEPADALDVVHRGGSEQ